MSIVIQKFGGTSVAGPKAINRVAKQILATRKKGNSVAVVVSAMGDATDKLIDLAHRITSSPNSREMDMLIATGEQVSSALLAMALHKLGVDAISLTGAQAGISTDAMHRKAKIMGINPQRVLKHLNEGRIVIVTGFQGITPANDVATLGRGGSDITALALAAALKVKRCQIFTDVNGVYSADPRIVKEARRLDEITYDEMLELASLGAQVLMGRAVEFAKKYGVRLEVLSSFKKGRGTIIKEEVNSMENIVVRSVLADKNQAKVTLSGVPDHPGIAAQIFKELAGGNINIDMIVQNVGIKGVADISFTVPYDDLPSVKQVLEKTAKKVGVQAIDIDKDVAKVSIVGAGMRGHSGVAFHMFKTLAQKKINIQMISTSEIKISVMIKKRLAEKAVRALYNAFALSKIVTSVQKKRMRLKTTRKKRK